VTRAVDRLRADEGLQGEFPVVAADPPQPDHGDYAVSVAFRLAKPLHQPPMKVAERLARVVEVDPAFARVEVAPPGYLNFRLQPAWLQGQLPGIEAASTDYGRVALGNGTSVHLDFGSSNPTGPLMFHHARGALIGDVLARVLAFAGFSVSREYLINDQGNQVRMLALSILAQLKGEPVPEGGYPGDYVSELAEEVRRSWPAERLNDPDTVNELATYAIDRMITSHRQDLERLDIRFDTWFSERSLYASGYDQETMRKLQELGSVTEHDGAVWFRSANGKEDVLYKRTGEPTYFASDVFYHRDRLERRGFQRLIDIWGADHQNQAPRVRDAMAALGFAPERLHILIFQLVTLKRGGATVRASRRKGEATPLREVIDEVGPDCVRYFFLLRSADAMMDFDVDLAKQQSNENPVFYAQYAHARLSNVLTFADAARAEARVALERLETEWELDLMRSLARWPEVVSKAATNLEPHHLPFYAYALAQRIHLFYKHCRVVTGDAALTAARLQLVRSSRVTLRNVLGLIGVTAPERM
jgi:arginyl-tRNA synthetase